MIVEMHEDVHGTQSLTQLKYWSKRPRLEIEAYSGSYANYVAIQGAPPPAPNLSMAEWDAYLGDNRHSRRKAWNKVVEIYDPLEKKKIKRSLSQQLKQENITKTETACKACGLIFLTPKLINSTLPSTTRTNRLICDAAKKSALST